MKKWHPSTKWNLLLEVIQHKQELTLSVNFIQIITNSYISLQWFLGCRGYSKFNQSCPGTLLVWLHNCLILFFNSINYQVSKYSSCHLQWMLQIPGATSYMGSIGKDKFGEEMKKHAKSAGVNVSILLVQSS